MPYNVILCQTPSFLGDLQNTLIPYHGEIGHCLVYFYRYIEPPVSLNFCILILFFFEWSTTTIRKSQLSQMLLRHEFFSCQ